MVSARSPRARQVLRTPIERLDQRRTAGGDEYASIADDTMSMSDALVASGSDTDFVAASGDDEEALPHAAQAPNWGIPLNGRECRPAPSIHAILACAALRVLPVAHGATIHSLRDAGLKSRGSA